MTETTTASPWLSMWTQPRSTIRALVRDRPKYGVLYLAAIYALESFFYYINWWSFGVNISLYTILFLGIVCSPILGFIWLYFSGWVFQISGKWLGGSAPALHLRTAISWSKIPSVVNVLMWLILILTDPELVFIQEGGGTSSIFVNLIFLILVIWSLVLLVQGVREVQGFSVGRALASIFVVSFFFFILSFVLFAFFRYIYLISV